MESIPDVIRRLVLELSPRDVLSLCLSKKSFSKVICNSDIFWRNKIKVDYPKQIYPLTFYEKNPKRLYMLLTMNSKTIELNEEDFPELTNINFEDEDKKSPSKESSKKESKETKKESKESTESSPDPPKKKRKE